MSNDYLKQFHELEMAYEYDGLRGNEVLKFYQEFEDIEVVDRNDEKTLVHYAASYADPIALRYLLEKGAQAQVFDNSKETPLHSVAKCTIQNGFGESDVKAVVDLLLEAGVSPLRKNSSDQCCFHLAANRDNFTFLQSMVDHEVRLKMTDGDGRNVLHILAINAGRHQESKRFIRGDDELAIHAKKAQQYFDMIKVLLDYGVDNTVMDSQKHLPEYYATEKNAKKVSVLLRDEYDESDPDNELKILAGGKTLHQAIKSDDIEAVDALIKLGCDVNEVCLEIPFANQTPLAVACMKMNVEAIKLLLQAQADPNFRDGEYERSALYWMIKYGYYTEAMYREKIIDELMTCLLASGLNLNQPVDEHDNSCIACACVESGTSYTFSYGSFAGLFIKKALKLQADINLTNKHGKTAIMEFVENLNYAKEDTLLDLLEHDARLDIKDNMSETVLMKAARNRNDSLMVQVVETMSDFGDLLIDATNNEGKTALDLAVENNLEELSKWIVERM